MQSLSFQSELIIPVVRITIRIRIRIRMTILILFVFAKILSILVILTTPVMWRNLAMQFPNCAILLHFCPLPLATSACGKAQLKVLVSKKCWRNLMLATCSSINFASGRVLQQYTIWCRMPQSDLRWSTEDDKVLSVFTNVSYTCASPTYSMCQILYAMWIWRKVFKDIITMEVTLGVR